MSDDEHVVSVLLAPGPVDLKIRICEVVPEGRHAGINVRSTLTGVEAVIKSSEGLAVLHNLLERLVLIISEFLFTESWINVEGRDLVFGQICENPTYGLVGSLEGRQVHVHFFVSDEFFNLRS
jgi:hypothetical protein